MCSSLHPWAVRLKSLVQNTWGTCKHLEIFFKPSMLQVMQIVSSSKEEIRGRLASLNVSEQGSEEEQRRLEDIELLDRGGKRSICQVMKLASQWSLNFEAN